MHFHQISLRVRYGETDQMGVVYHGNYPQYLEMGRVEWLRSLGISYKSMEEKGCFLPVVSLQINYKKPALYDELITVVTRLRKLPGFRRRKYFSPCQYRFGIYGPQKKQTCPLSGLCNGKNSEFLKTPFKLSAPTPLLWRQTISVFPYSAQDLFVKPGGSGDASPVGVC